MHNGTRLEKIKLMILLSILTAMSDFTDLGEEHPVKKPETSYLRQKLVRLPLQN